MSNETAIRKTLLNEEHKNLGARMVEFAGWEMPVLYTGVIEEHRAVRAHVGLFDVSHMGEVFFRGPNALKTLQWLTTNDVSVLEKGQAQYSLLPNSTGGLVDDIIVYCLEKNQEYLVCVNASNADKDFDWMQTHNKGAEITNESDKWSQIAIQGPKAHALLEKVLGNEIKNLKPFHCEYFKFQNTQVLVAATGYTGEKGAEIFVKNENVVALWQDLMKKGEALQVHPIGLGARDTLRTEMKYSLYGHEIDDVSSPIEASLGWVVKFNKGDFMGREKMLQTKEKGPARKLVGFKLLDKGIPRQGYKLFSTDGQEIGHVTSGTMSPSLDEAIGIGYVKEPYSAIDSRFLVEIRHRKVEAKVVKTPFVQPT